MSDEVEKLLQQIDSANSEPKKLEFLGELQELKDVAEKSIRSHQRAVNYDTKEFTIEIIVQKYSDGLELDENELFVPDYQRDFVWLKNNQSRLIESLLIGLPIPYIFVADVSSEDPDLDGRVEIVDGSQRIRTLHAFLTNQLKLEGLTLVPELNGFRFKDLIQSRQRRFNRFPIRTIELSNCTEATRRDLWERINTGSDDLRDMEKRKGSKHGNSNLYKSVLAICADNSNFQKLAPISKTKSKRGEPMEFVLRFFAYLDDYQNFDHSVRDFLDTYLENNANIDDPTASSMVSEFEKVMNFVNTYIPLGFRKSNGSKTTPRVRFESMAVGVALALRENSTLVPSNIDNWLFTEEFKKLTTGDGANSRIKVRDRIEYVRDKLLGDI